MSRKKSTAKAKLKATSQQERIHLWKQHFRNLLGKPPKVTRKQITKIISNQQDIKLEQLKQEELDSVLEKIFRKNQNLLHSLERAAAGIGLHVNANKTEYMCFNQKGDISPLKGGLLKLVDKFTYSGSCVSSTGKDINTQLAKAWTAPDRLSVIWKSDLTDKIKHSFSKQLQCRYCYMDALHGR